MGHLSNRKLIFICFAIFCVLYLGVTTDIFVRFLSVLRPFINGFVLAYLTGILIFRVESKLPFKSRGLAILLVYILFLGGLALFLMFLIPMIVDSLFVLREWIPELWEQIPALQLDGLFHVQASAYSFYGLVRRGIELFVYARGQASNVVGVVLSLVISIYVLLTYEHLFDFLRYLGKALFADDGAKFGRYVARLHELVCKFLLAQVFASFVLGLFAGLVLWIVGVNGAPLIGMIIGILNIFPLFGSVIGVGISGVILFLTNSPMLALAGLIFLLFLQQLDAIILTPKLMGSKLSLNPILIIFVLTFSGAYLGFIGMLLALPVCASLIEIVKERLQRG